MSTWSVEIRNDRALFSELAPWWNECPGPLSIPFLRTEWFEIWTDSFLSRGSNLEIAVWKHDGEPIAVLPLSRRGLRRSALANSQSEVFDVITSPNTDVAPTIEEWLAHQPVSRLFRLDGESLLIPTQPDPNWHVDRQSRAPFIDLGYGMEGVLNGLGRNLIKNLRRLERRTAELGEVVYLDNADGVIPDALEQCMRLEASGWKGRVGTAMISRPDTARFYEELVGLARDRGWLRICSLLVAERIVAFELDLDYHGRRFSLKAGYDQELSRLSPGKVLQQRVLEAAVAGGLSSYEFGGEAEEWKLEWTNSVHPRINVLRFGDRGMSRLLGQAMRGVAQRRARSGSSGDQREVPNEL